MYHRDEPQEKFSGRFFRVTFIRKHSDVGGFLCVAWFLTGINWRKNGIFNGGHFHNAFVTFLWKIYANYDAFILKLYLKQLFNIKSQTKMKTCEQQSILKTWVEKIPIFVKRLFHKGQQMHTVVVSTFSQTHKNNRISLWKKKFSLYNTEVI